MLVEEFEGHREVPERATFVVDPDHRVQFAWQAANPSDQPDMDALRKATRCRGDECAVENEEAA